MFVSLCGVWFMDDTPGYFFQYSAFVDSVLLPFKCMIWFLCFVLLRINQFIPSSSPDVFIFPKL